MYPRLSINWNIRADGGGCIDWVLCSLMISFASIAGACFSSQLGRESALEHRISIRLIELEQAQSPIRFLPFREQAENADESAVERAESRGPFRSLAS